MRRRFTVNKGFTKTFDINNYLTIEALEDDFTLFFANDIEYGIDGKGWMKLKTGNRTQPVNSGQTLSFRGNLTPNSSNGIGSFIISKKCNLLGNCMSMLFGDDAANNYSLSGKDYAFCTLFANCSNIITVSENFLPAITLAYNCYYYMFYGCTSLTTAPELPATTLADYCYYSMFRDCSKLNYIKMLATDISAMKCFDYWVYNVASTGTFVKSPDMNSLTTGDSGIPSGWTVVNDGEESEQVSVTIELGQYYPDVIYYLENKYGLGYGEIRSPIAIEEDIWIGESFEGSGVSVGKVKYLFIDDIPTTVGILLYLDDFRNTYRCVALNNYRQGIFFGRASDYFWD